MDQEILYKAQYLEKNSQEAQANLQFVNTQIEELEKFKQNLSDLDNSSEKEMLSSIGKGVYTKTELKDKDLFVDVGSGVIVKKTPEQTKKVLETQIKTLMQAKIQITGQIESYTNSLIELMNEIQKLKSSSEKKE